MGTPFSITQGDTTMAQHVTATLYTMESNSKLSDTSYYVKCWHGCEYSANPSDYFMASDTTQFTCDCEGEPMVCSLMQRRYINGTTPDGHPFYGTVSVEILNGVTVGTLRGLKGAN